MRKPFTPLLERPPYARWRFVQEYAFVQAFAILFGRALRTGDRRSRHRHRKAGRA